MSGQSRRSQRFALNTRLAERRVMGRVASPAHGTRESDDGRVCKQRVYEWQMIRLTSFGDVILSGNDRGDVWFEASFGKLILMKIWKQVSIVP